VRDRSLLGVRKALLVTGGLVLAVAAQLLRQQGTPPWDSVQSDDGTGFLSAAWGDGGISLLWTSNAGYLVLVPRLVAAPLEVVPRSWGAAYLSVTSALIAALLAWFVACAARGLVRQAWLRWTLALAVVLLPATGWETTAVLTQQQFALVFAAFWAIITEQRSRPMLVARVVVVVLAATSGPLTLTLLPLAAAVAWWRRARADVIVAVGLVAGSLVQAVTVLVAEGPPAGEQSVRAIPGIYLQRVIASWLVGDTQLDDAWLELGVPLLVVSALVAVALAVLLAATVERRQWVWAGAAFLWSGIVFAASLWTRGLAGDLAAREGSFTYDGARYVLVPIWLLLSGYVLLAGGPPRPVSSALARARDVARVVVAAQLVVVVVLGFRLDTLRSPGPSFAGQLRHVEAACREQPSERALILFSPRRFYALVPCVDP
jgi:hypothetical protein